MADAVEEGFVARDWVYIGKRQGDKEVFVGIQPIMEDGTLGKPMYYSHKKKFTRVIGGVYTGTSFKEGTARGLEQANWKKMWESREDRIRWQAEEDLVEADLRLARMEKEAGRIPDIEQIMLPLRKQYESYRFRKDYAGMEALEKAVLRALRSAPRVIEKE